MKSLKSIFQLLFFPQCEHTKKQTRMCQKWTLSSLLKCCFFALNFFEFKRRTETFLFALLFIKNKATREEKTKTKKPPTSSYTFATSSSPSMSSNRFFPFVSFSCFSCSNFCFAWSVLDAFRRDGRDDIFFLFDSIRTSTKGKKTIDRWERSLMSLSLFNNKGRNIEKEKKRL